MNSNKDEIILKKIGTLIKKARIAKKLSLRNLAALCTVDHSDIAKIEKGQVNITLLTMYDLAEALDIEPKMLLDFELKKSFR